MKESEKRRLIELSQKGDMEAREELTMGNLRLVLSTLKRFSQRGENLSDLFQVGCIGLIKAIDNFNLDLNLRFSTYAVPSTYLWGKTHIYKQKMSSKHYNKDFDGIRPKEEKMKDSKVIAICNQKGGVGKTTTTVNLGVGLSMKGKKVLVIDADPQGDLTVCFGWNDTDSIKTTLATKLSDVLTEKSAEPLDGILNHSEGISLLPSNLELSAMEMNLVNAMSRETTLKNYLEEIKSDYDYILIDCMPSLGMITLNALSAADSVIIPVQAQYLPAKGMTQLIHTISKVKKYINPKLKIDGILLTLVDRRTNLAKKTADIVRQYAGEKTKMFKTSIPIAVKAAEVSSKGHSIYSYDKDCAVAKAYLDFTEEVLSIGR